MRQRVFSESYLDADGNPSGGVAFGRGFCVSWQRGPLGPGPHEDDSTANGAFVEGLIQAVIARIHAYQGTRYDCVNDADSMGCGQGVRIDEDGCCFTCGREARPVAAGRFACPENVEALAHLEAALGALDARTASRRARGVEGTHTP